MSYTGLMTNMVHPDDLQVVATAIRNSFTGSDSSIEIECRIKNKSTDTFEWFNIKGSITERDTMNNPLKAAGFIFGIQARKEAEEKLARAKNVAENSLKIKRKFLANISHEIRTPLHAIIGLGEQISLSELNKKQQVQINMMNESAKGLLGIINDLLDYSRIEDGKLSFESVSFNLREMLYTVYHLFEHAVDKKNLKLDYEVDASAEELFIGDPLRLRQIITNIISNAIKFTEKGSVTIRFTVLQENNVDCYLLFTCADTGIGMSDEMKRKLFEDFSQEDESFQRKYGGSGLGLSITRELVRFMGGLIEIESKKNIGTSVTIKLPLKKNNEALQDHTTYNADSIHSNEVSFESLRILAAEDNEFNRLLLKFIFEKHNINYVIAVNGKEAIRFLDEEEFDLVLMDIQMPDMDGLEATAHIRHQMNKIPIIAMTANAVKEELEAYLTLGFTDYITKPFEETALLEKLMLYLKKESTYVH
jgi:signal transduction histidine kinase/ActR/RegA family two-component response regulator